MWHHMRMSIDGIFTQNGENIHWAAVLWVEISWEIVEKNVYFFQFFTHLSSWGLTACSKAQQGICGGLNSQASDQKTNHHQ